MNVDTLLTGSGTAGLILGAAYVGRLLLDGWREKRTGDREDTTSTVQDAAATNALMLGSLTALQAENGRQAARIRHLEEEADLKDAKIRDLEQRVQAIADELAALKTS